MQFQNIVAAAALVASVAATPLVKRQQQQQYGASVSATPSVPHASYVPHASFVPGTHGDDGYGTVTPGNVSVVFCPVEKAVKISGFARGQFQTEKHAMRCLDNGAEYETIETSLLSAPLNVHGGNLCTSNSVQYYLWPGRMYEYLWLAYGMMPVDVPHDNRCELVNRGEVARCILPAYAPFASPTIPHGPSVSGVHVSAYPSHASAVPSYAPARPNASNLPHY